MIREATIDEISVIHECQMALALETEGMKLDEAKSLQGVKAIFNNPDQGNYWVYEEDGQIVGCLLTLFEWSDWRNGSVVWIHSVYVKQDCRGRGVYRRMYESLQQTVREKGFCGIRLFVDKTNVDAQKTYSKLGMNGDHYSLFEWMNDQKMDEFQGEVYGFKSILDEALPIASRVVLKGSFGICELRGDDLCAKESSKSVTVFHESAPGSEDMSHVHLKRNTFKSCHLKVTQRGTEYLEFHRKTQLSSAGSTLKIYLKDKWKLGSDLQIGDCP